MAIRFRVIRLFRGSGLIRFRGPTVALSPLKVRIGRHQPEAQASGQAAMAHSLALRASEPEN